MMCVRNHCVGGLSLLGFVSAVLLGAVPALAGDFGFDGSMPRAVLERYLDRSISFTELLHDDLNQPRNRRGVDPRDNVRFLTSAGAKFVGRALMVWGRERELMAFLAAARPFAAALHEADPEMILQAAAFEIVTAGVEAVAVPEPVHRRRDRGHPLRPGRPHGQERPEARGLD